jgi:hypothetical protein
MSTLDRNPDDPAHAPGRAAIAETGGGLHPKPGWESKVWERIDAETTSMAGGHARSRRAVWLVGAGVLAAAAAIALVVWRGGGRSDPDQRVVVAEATLEIRHSATVVRGTSAAPGDTAVVHHGARGAVVWVYRGESELVLACDAARVAAPACTRDRDGVSVEVLLDRPGTYHVLTAAGTLVAPPSVDDARAMLTTAGVRFRHDELDVR